MSSSVTFCFMTSLCACLSGVLSGPDTDWPISTVALPPEAVEVLAPMFFGASMLRVALAASR